MAQKLMLHSENCIIRQHLSNVCPCVYYNSMTFDPSNALHSGQGFFPPNLVAIGHFNFKQIDPTWPQLTPSWPLTPAMHYALSGILPTKFGGHRSFLSNWPLVDPSWPLHDLWPQQCIMLWSGILATKFGGHKALLSKLTPTWPQLTPTWPLTPAMHNALVRDSSHLIWWP